MLRAGNGTRRSTLPTHPGGDDAEETSPPPMA